MPDQRKKLVVQYVTGLDLGQAQDFTALAVIERSLVPKPEDERIVGWHYSVRHLERFPIGTAYTDICESLVAMYQKKPLSRSTLVVDFTGVGRPVVDMLRRAKIKAELQPLTITGGHQAAPSDGIGWNVPKKDLVSTLQVLFQARRLKVAQSLPEAQTLVRELQNFQVKITTAANEVFGAWREGQHDDLVLAVGIAAWHGERFGVSGTGTVKSAGSLRPGLNLSGPAFPR